MASLRTTPSIMELFADLLAQVSKLLSLEFELARSELAASSSRVAGGLGKVAVGAVLLLAGMFFLLAAICAFLVRLGVPVDLSCLIVAVVVMAGGWFALKSGTSAFEPTNLLPRRSLGQISSFIRRA